MLVFSECKRVVTIGDAARRAGNEHLFQMLAETNLATFEEIGVKKIVSPALTVSHFRD